jgi:hypothetical protein
MTVAGGPAALIIRARESGLGGLATRRWLALSVWSGLERRLFFVTAREQSAYFRRCGRGSLSHRYKLNP